MKKFTLKFLFFIFSLLLIIFVLENIIINIKSYDRYRFQYEELFEPKVKANVVIFGASASARGINPEILETDSLSVFNFGLNGANPEFLFNWYTNFFNKYYPVPKLILLEVSWLMFDKDFMWRKIEQDSKYFPILELQNILSLSKDKDYVSYLSNCLNIRNRQRAKGEATELYYNGYEPHPYKQKEIKFGPDSINFNSKTQKKYFDLLLKKISNDNNKIIFIMLPQKISLGENNKTIINSNIEYIKKCAKDYNIEFFNYMSEIKTDTLFDDWAHLNINGANIISNRIKQDLKTSSYKRF